MLSFEEAFEEPGGFGLIFRDRLAQRDVWEELVAQPLPAAWPAAPPPALAPAPLTWEASKASSCSVIDPSGCCGSPIHVIIAEGESTM